MSMGNALKRMGQMNVILVARAYITSRFESIQMPAKKVIFTIDHFARLLYKTSTDYILISFMNTMWNAKEVPCHGIGQTMILATDGHWTVRFSNIFPKADSETNIICLGRKEQSKWQKRH
jgi:hypothetical protein